MTEGVTLRRPQQSRLRLDLLECYLNTLPPHSSSSTSILSEGATIVRRRAGRTVGPPVPTVNSLMVLERSRRSVASQTDRD